MPQIDSAPCSDAPQPGHLGQRPASSSRALSRLPHAHGTSMDMLNPNSSPGFPQMRAAHDSGPRPQQTKMPSQARCHTPDMWSGMAPPPEPAPPLTQRPFLLHRSPIAGGGRLFAEALDLDHALALLEDPLDAHLRAGGDFGDPAK